MSHNKYKTIDCRDASTGTFPYGINDKGVIVGYYGVPFHNYGFVYANGQCKKLPDIQGSTPYPMSVNNAGTIVGYYYVATNVAHGFELKGKKYRDISVPNSSQTFAGGVNGNNDISGTYNDSAGTHGFLLRIGNYQTIDVPGSAGTTSAVGLNDKDLVVGSYQDPKRQAYEGFVYNAGKFVELIVPGSVTTFPASINNSNVVAGEYFHGTVNPEGFVATPSRK